MNQTHRNSRQALSYQIGVALVDEAVFIFRQVHKLTTDVRLCRCTVQHAISEVLSVAEHQSSKRFVRVSFRSIHHQSTDVYLNISHLLKAAQQ